MNLTKKRVKMRILSLLFIASMSCIFWGCAADTAETEQEKAVKELQKGLEEASKNFGEGAEGMEKALGELGKTLGGISKDGEKVQPVNFRELKKVMPDNIAGLERTSNTGETTGAMGFKVSTAKSKYVDGDQNIKVEVTDVAGFGGALLGLASWSQLEVDKETDDGYERTTTFNGHKAYEKYDGKRKRGELKLLFNDRVVVQVTGRGVEMDDLKASTTKIIKGLEGVSFDE